VFSILELIDDWPPIKIIDIGAMSLGQGTEPYNRLMKRGIADIIGFEPVQMECDKLNAMANDRYTYLPYFIGDGSVRTFYQCNYSMTSSLYEPNTPLLDKFQNIENLTRVIKTEKVQTRRLDDIPEVCNADYLKVDVQGGEVDVYNGASQLLKDIILIHTEVVFVPLYKNQPLFAEIDQVLRKNGFLFHKFTGIAGRMFKPVLIRNNINAALSQQLWADAVYIKDFMALEKLSAEKLLKLAIILHEVYNAYDMCCHVLGYYDEKSSTHLFDQYLQRLAGDEPTMPQAHVVNS